MSMTIDEIAEECRSVAAERGSQCAVLDRLAELDVEPVDAIKTVRRVYGMSLAEAKRLVTDHPKWRPAAENAQSLHDELEDALRRDDT